MLYNEEAVRANIRNREGKRIFYLGKGDQLTSAARDYLSRERIEIRPGEQAKQDCFPLLTGGFLTEKPEHMTQLFGNVLVAKDHPRIHFRGKLDSLQALVVLDQVQIAEGGCQKLVDDLGNILGILREMMRCDALDEAFKNETIIGLTHAELRERSHNPQKFFGVQYMQLPDYTMGRDYALLNQLRAAVRETEVAATEAFRVGNKYTRKDIIEELNRLSSAIHIMMCMYLAGQYR